MAEKFDEYEKILKRKPQVKISGSGRVSDEEVSISGSGMIIGDFETKVFKVSGSATVDGKVIADYIKVSGSASFNDDVEANEIIISGSSSFKGKVTCKLMKISGSCKLLSDLDVVDSLKLSGSIKVDGNLHSKGLVDLKGAFTIEGEIIARKFYADVKGKSEVKGGIKAEDVEIYGGVHETGIVLFGITIIGLKRKGAKLYTSNIYAKNRIHIEGVVCDNVEGSIVEIGRGCEIKGKVRYKDRVEVHSEAKLANPPEKVE
ncbi:MAG: hypothetical protein DRJ26_03405 [Candidatus Methanomethylicota archaeon]|uniref:Polymer-forming cytoskeletal protein n=1 Tax=Thermoproteota archaeon TaxID=2056631 RepID=A0A497F240_9CREN|nr:MAG: hypothetical protein DRJ26_03405 [Candidatus Verstraetearchaeota archaeon]